MRTHLQSITRSYFHNMSTLGPDLDAKHNCSRKTNRVYNVIIARRDHLNAAPRN